MTLCAFRNRASGRNGLETAKAQWPARAGWGSCYDRLVVTPAYPILTERLELRPYREDDLDAFFAIQSREDVTRYLYWDPQTREGAREALAARMTRTRLDVEGDGLALAAVLRESGALIGGFSLVWRSSEHRQGEIGFELHPDHHGRGYGTEGAPEMLRIGFEALGLHRIIGRADARNTGSARLMERLGMRREAHLVENEFIKGEWCDELVYAMLDREWQASPHAAGVVAHRVVPHRVAPRRVAPRADNPG